MAETGDCQMAIDSLARDLAGYLRYYNEERACTRQT